MSVILLLSIFQYTQVFIGQFPEKFFTEESILDIQSTFSNELAELQKAFKERNSKLEEVKQYTFLLPENEVPRSIAI